MKGKMMNEIMKGVTEYGEEYDVELAQTTGIYESKLRGEQRKGFGRWVVRAWNNGRHNTTEVDVCELITWLRANRPELLETES